MQIINTSSGPAILTDASDVVMPGDLEAIAQMLAEDSKIVADLVAGLAIKVEASVAVIAKVKKLEPLDDHDAAILHVAQTSHMNIENVSRAIRLHHDQEEAHEHE